MSRPALAFLGLGVMGSVMARRLVAAGFPVTVWNRSPGPAARLAAHGARVAANPAAAAEGVEIVLYSLSDGAAVEAVMLGEAGVIAGLAPGQLAIDLGTMPPDVSRRQAAACAAVGCDFLDAPVFGSRPEAEAGELSIVVGGERAVYERALEVFEPLAATTHHMGPTGSGAAMGLIGSLMVCHQLEALSEGLVMAHKAGLDVAEVVRILGLPDFRSPLFTGMGAGILRRDFTPVFSLEHLAKDARAILHLAARLDAPVPGCEVASANIERAIERGLGGENASALVKVLEERAGVVVGDDGGSG